LAFIPQQSTQRSNPLEPVADLTPLGAGVVLDPNRLVSVSSSEASITLRYLTRRACPRCRHIDCTAVCTQCGEFKYPKRIAPFAIELDAQERQAA
jgi:hypothetical protein